MSKLLIVLEGNGAHYEVEVMIAYLGNIELSQLKYVEVWQYLVQDLLLLLLIQLLINFEQKRMTLDTLLEIFEYLVSDLIFNAVHHK